VAGNGGVRFEAALWERALCGQPGGGPLVVAAALAATGVSGGWSQSIQTPA